ncbi:DUF1499 domain-containing protein [Methylocapsa sp. S129]|uniref:DUF1499 domain-containing protein n=1 Tax=Methylocapsa sp. S129 TaxID=1641869 RepID=UPI00131DB218|nr:DUF1499 domain-containing protein [Methylocapsa sp. S129]
MRRLILEEPYSRAAIWSRRLAVFALAVAATGAGLSRAGAVEPAGALAVLGASLVLACLAGLLSATAAIVIWRTGRRGAGIAFVGLALALGLLAYPAWLSWRAISLPAINDVSTDLETPPSFLRSVKALEARGGRTPPEASPEAREAQQRAYPKIQPILVDMETNEAYQLALEAAKARGWRIVDAIAPSVREGVGHIDASDKSLFLGFVDDIAIRIKPLANQTRIDIRSTSRIWRHDFGANAQRIQKFADAVQELAQEK